jgi:hypothetical protein
VAEEALVRQDGPDITVECDDIVISLNRSLLSRNKDEYRSE